MEIDERPQAIRTEPWSYQPLHRIGIDALHLGVSPTQKQNTKLSGNIECRNYGIVEKKMQIAKLSS
jgi:hypothetical protein